MPVWLGAGLALTVQAVVAVAAGRLLVLLPHTMVQVVIAVLFMGGAAYLIAVPEKVEETKGEQIGERAGIVSPDWRVTLTVFAIVALAEFGDITQILIANLTARYRDPWGVLLGAAAGFWVVAGFGVLAGSTITRYVPLGIVRRISGAILLGLGIWTIVDLVR